MTSSGPNAPLPTPSILPLPSINEPVHVTFAVRSVAIQSPPSRVVVISMPTPASRRSEEKEQPSCAASTAASNCSASSPGTRGAHVERRVDDQVPAALDLVHRDPAVDVEPPRRRARAGELAGERHREAAAVRRGEELLGARLALGPGRAAIRVGSE